MNEIEVEFHFIRPGPLAIAFIWFMQLPVIRHLGGWYAAEWMIDRTVRVQIDEVCPAEDYESIEYERVTPEEMRAELTFLEDCEEFGEDPFDPDFQLDLFEDNDEDFTLDPDELDPEPRYG